MLSLCRRKVASLGLETTRNNVKITLPTRDSNLQLLMHGRHEYCMVQLKGDSRERKMQCEER